MPLGTSLVPPNIDIEKYLTPPPPPVPCEQDMTTFEPSPVPLHDDFTIRYKDQEGNNQTWILQPGMLVSECGFLEIINTAAEHKRMKHELGVLTKLRLREYDIWRQAEWGYQTRIVELEQDLKEERTGTWWDEWKGEVMFGLGIAVTAAVIVGSVEIIQAVGK